MDAIARELHAATSRLSVSRLLSRDAGLVDIPGSSFLPTGSLQVFGDLRAAIDRFDVAAHAVPVPTTPATSTGSSGSPLSAVLGQFFDST
jgi:hypothetical protein